MLIEWRWPTWKNELKPWINFNCNVNFFSRMDIEDRCPVSKLSFRENNHSHHAVTKSKGFQMQMKI
jgi:hypothetical protein